MSITGATRKRREDRRLPVSRAIVARDFRHPNRRNFTGRAFAATTERRNLRVSERRFSCRLAQLLPLTVAEYQVFRAALFLIVLTLTVGQNAGLLCTVWCPEATSTQCPHQDSTTSPSVRADDTCTNVAVAAVAFVNEDGRRTAPATDSQSALAVLRFRFLTPPVDPLRGYESGRRWLLEERPLVIALRI
jgi:hypothetical protein